MTEKRRRYIREWMRRWRKTHKKKYNAYQREWFRQNPERKLQYRLKVYDLTREDYEAMVRKQGGRCLICRRPPSKKSTKDMRLSVDHDHRTGKVRGLLCRPCNAALGSLERFWNRAVAYMAR